jgi:hypothetical protein
MVNILKVIGVLLFLALAFVLLAVRFRLTESEDHIKKDKNDGKSILARIIRNSLMMR